MNDLLSSDEPLPGRSRAAYARDAENALGVPDGSRTTRNHAITRAYVTGYRLDRRAFKWSGLAAFASSCVGSGLRACEILTTIGMDVPLAACVGVHSSQFAAALAAGNNAVYDDIYWQHLAYHTQKLADLERIYDAEHEGLLYAWNLIDRGLNTSNTDLIWEGNEELLFHEQNYVLAEATYAPNERLWKLLSASLLFRFFGGFRSPIPDRGIPFHEFDDGADLADPHARWRWIQEILWPAWKELDINHDEVDRLLTELR